MTAALSRGAAPRPPCLEKTDFPSPHRTYSGMPKLTRIYTRTGDDGTTGLVGGQRIKKDALRIACYGTIDELSSAIGLVRSALRKDAPATDRIARLDRWLAWTQDVLFNLGSDLATLPKDRWEGMPLVRGTDAQALERAIDEAQKDLDPLDNFIHPGGALPGAFLHLARTICRRAERAIVSLAEQEQLSTEVCAYVNRLSDALFVWARWINHELGQPEHLWTASTAPPD
ncbi:MAG: cob(I)yrinic acid a,c-diamide adenosyltransferase [Vulcanimicrobiaceae bacterium]